LEDLVVGDSCAPSGLELCPPTSDGRVFHLRLVACLSGIERFDVQVDALVVGLGLLNAQLVSGLLIR
jgi:hypothetical protein